MVMGLSQEKLAERLGITFQQIQKYERGQNRISAGRLFRLSQLLEVEVAYFFNDHDWANQAMPANTPQPTAAVAEDRAQLEQPDWRNQESMDLLRHYYNITDRDLRKRVMEIVKSMAQHSSTEEDGSPSPADTGHPSAAYRVPTADNPVALLLAHALNLWADSGHVSYPVELFSTGFTIQGQRLLERFGFAPEVPAEQMANQRPLFVKRATSKNDLFAILGQRGLDALLPE